VVAERVCTCVLVERRTAYLLGRHLSGVYRSSATEWSRRTRSAASTSTTMVLAPSSDGISPTHA
jgi:hypothetical protein